MKNNMLRSVCLILAPVLSGVLLVLAFPKHDFGWLAWWGLVPLFVAIHDKRPLGGFFLSLIFGIVFIAGIFDWIRVVNGYKIYHHTILVLYLALYFGFWGLIFVYIARRKGLTLAFLAAPFVWVSLEYLRANFLFLALPWALLAHTQHDTAAIIQIASITGAYGISFLIVLVNAAVAVIVIALSSRFRWFHRANTKLSTKREVSFIIVTTIVLFTFAFLFGQIVLSKPKKDEDIKIAVLQGDIEQSKKWNPKYAKAIMNTYIELSEDAAKDKPQLVVWPEAATPGLILKNMVFHREMIRLIRKSKCYYLIGSSEHPKFQKDPPALDDVGNSALFFSPEGKVLGQYFKKRLVPFVEYVPYENSFDWPDFIVPQGKASWEFKGNEYIVFEMKGTRFGVSICWESLFPDLFRQFVKQGANFMLNISSEAWFGVSDFQYQFLAATKFRAVENRISIARAGNYTVSCFIDPYGRVVERFPEYMMDEKSFGRGHLTHIVTTSNERTFYTVYGDIFTFIVVTMTILVIIFAFLKKLKIETNLTRKTNCKSLNC